MMNGDMSEHGSPPKQTPCNKKPFEDIKGDKAIPYSGGLGQDLLEQSYEQVQVELFEDDDNGGVSRERRCTSPDNPQR